MNEHERVFSGVSLHSVKGKSFFVIITDFVHIYLAHSSNQLITKVIVNELQDSRICLDHSPHFTMCNLVTVQVLVLKPSQSKHYI